MSEQITAIGQSKRINKLAGASKAGIELRTPEGETFVVMGSRATTGGKLSLRVGVRGGDGILKLKWRPLELGDKVQTTLGEAVYEHAQAFKVTGVARG